MRYHTRINRHRSVAHADVIRPELSQRVHVLLSSDDEARVDAYHHGHEREQQHQQHQQHQRRMRKKRSGKHKANGDSDSEQAAPRALRRLSKKLHSNNSSSSSAVPTADAGNGVFTRMESRSPSLRAQVLRGRSSIGHGRGGTGQQQSGSPFSIVAGRHQGGNDDDDNDEVRSLIDAVDPTLPPARSSAEHGGNEYGDDQLSNASSRSSTGRWLSLAHVGRMLRLKDKRRAADVDPFK